MKATTAPDGKTIIPFLRRDKRRGSTPQPHPPSLNRLLEKLERMEECDCHIKVIHGFIPAHTSFLQKSIMINNAFKHDMAEKRNKVIDLSFYQTWLVLWMIEFLYTDSLQFLSINIPHVNDFFQLFFLFHYLDIPEAITRLLEEICQSAHATIKKYWKEEETIIPPTLGLLMNNKKELDDYGATDSLFRIIWLVMEENVIIMPSSLSLFCDIFFDKRFFWTGECHSYYNHFSKKTMKEIVDYCGRDCKRHNWSYIIRGISKWMSVDPVGRMIHIASLLSSCCFKKVEGTFINSFFKNRSLFHSFIKPRATKHFEQHMKYVEKVKKEGSNYWNILLPFSTCGGFSATVVKEQEYDSELKSEEMEEEVKSTYRLLEIALVSYWRTNVI